MSIFSSIKNINFKNSRMQTTWPELVLVLFPIKFTTCMNIWARQKFYDCVQQLLTWEKIIESLHALHSNIFQRQTFVNPECNVNHTSHNRGYNHPHEEFHFKSSTVCTVVFPHSVWSVKLKTGIGTLPGANRNRAELNFLMYSIYLGKTNPTCPYSSYLWINY